MISWKTSASVRNLSGCAVTICMTRMEGSLSGCSSPAEYMGMLASMNALGLDTSGFMGGFQLAREFLRVRHDLSPEVDEPLDGAPDALPSDLLVGVVYESAYSL